MPVQVRPQAALQAFRFDKPKWPLALLERRATAELVQELLVLLEDLLVGAVLAAQEKFEGFPCCPSVPPPPQSCYLCFHITLPPSKSHHGIVHPVAVGNSFHGADVNLQGPQSFQHPRLQVSQGHWYMFWLRNIFPVFACGALACWYGCRPDPLQVHGFQFSRAHAVTLFAHAPGAVLAPVLDHLPFIIGWAWQVGVVGGHVSDFTAGFCHSSLLRSFRLLTGSGKHLLGEEELSSCHPLVSAHQGVVLQLLLEFPTHGLPVLQVPLPCFLGLSLLAVLQGHRFPQKLLHAL